MNLVKRTANFPAIGPTRASERSRESDLSERGPGSKYPVLRFERELFDQFLNIGLKRINPVAAGCTAGLCVAALLACADFLHACGAGPRLQSLQIQ